MNGTRFDRASSAMSAFAATAVSRCAGIALLSDAIMMASIFVALIRLSLRSLLLVAPVRDYSICPTGTQPVS